MTSAIIATNPVATVPTTQSVRDNFAAAKSEISALQAATVAAAEGTTGTLALASVADVNTGTATDTAVTPAGVEGWTGGTNLVTVGAIATGTWEGDVVAEAFLENQSGTNTGDNVTATTSTEGILELGTQTEVDGTSGNTIVTPATLALRKGQMTLIETITNASAGEFDFTSIPSTYTRLIIKGHIRGDVTAVEDSCLLFMNTDTTVTNYHTQRSGAHNAAIDVAEGANPEICIVPAASSPANSYSQIEIVIENYTGSHLKQASSAFSSYTDTDIIRNGSNSLVSVITAAITRLRVQSDNHATDQLFGELHLYGEQ